MTHAGSFDAREAVISRCHGDVNEVAGIVSTVADGINRVEGSINGHDGFISEHCGAINAPAGIIYAVCDGINEVEGIISTVVAGINGVEGFINADDAGINEVCASINALAPVECATRASINAPCVVNVWYRANPGIGGDTADAEPDRLPNLVEYALGLSPTAPDANPFSPVVTNNSFQITFSQSKSAVDVTLTPEWSQDLLNWFNGPAYLIETSCIDAGAIQWITMRTSSAVSTNSSGFLRVRAARK